MASSKNAAIHNKTIGKLKKIDKNKKIEEIKSIKLSISPLIINNPLVNNSTLAKIRKTEKTPKPNIKDKKATAAAKSIRPRIFTNII